MSLVKSLGSVLKKLPEDYAEALKDVMKNETHKRTGALADSISIEKKGNYNYVVGVDASKLASDPRNVSKTDYSMAYWKGIKQGYTIRPKYKKALHWVDENGNDVFAKKVTIKPRPGDPFIERTIQNRPKPKIGG